MEDNGCAVHSRKTVIKKLQLKSTYLHLKKIDFLIVIDLLSNLEFSKGKFILFNEFHESFVIQNPTY